MSKAGRARRSPERRIEARKMRSGNTIFQRELRQHMIDDAIAKADPKQIEYLASDAVSETELADPTETLRRNLNTRLHQH